MITKKLRVPLIIQNYSRVNGVHTVEIADLNRGNGLVNIVLKYVPGDLYAQTTSIEASYDSENAKFKIHSVELRRREGVSLQHFHDRLLDVDLVLQDPDILDYARSLEEISKKNP